MFYRLLLQVFDRADFVTTKIMAESTTRRYLTKFCNMKIIKSDGKKQRNKILSTLRRSLII